MLRFELFHSAVQTRAWELLHNYKLHILRLEESSSRLRLRLTYSCSRRASEPAVLHFVEDTAAPDGPPTPVDAEAGPAVRFAGSVRVVNTWGELKSLNKSDFLRASAARLWSRLLDADSRRSPSSMVEASLVVYADLKTHKYIYFFAFPAFATATPFTSPGTLRSLRAEAGVPVVRRLYSGLAAFLSETTSVPPFLAVTGIMGPGGPRALSLAEAWEYEERGALVFAFFDPAASEQALGWPARNLCIHLRTAWGLDRVTLLAIRGPSLAAILGAAREERCEGCVHDDRSVLVDVDLASCGLPPFASPMEPVPKVVGWELGPSGKATPKMADLGSRMSGDSLAEASADLNLKLMRWRQVPELDTDMLARTRVLLLGAGTLGCAVARTLLGWGVRNMTLLDSGRVSYSNPSRQSLYEFADCERGAYKAEAAAAALKRIFPGVNAAGVVLGIPMPGHSVEGGELAAASDAVQRLDALVRAHDVVFLLTDTRESRWLPTMLCVAHDKLLINAALGFDSFLVMRHGGSFQRPQRLGCYFCNDIVAPVDSTRDRTMDQQCTVTRPGLAPMAAAVGVEVRHFMRTFEHVLPHGQAFPQCTACSEAVARAYLSEGFEMVRRCCRDPAHLASLSGLDQLTVELDDLDEFALEEDDEVPAPAVPAPAPLAQLPAAVGEEEKCAEAWPPL